MNKIINIIGAGLAGSEAAYQLAERGFTVKLHEMRPSKTTPAHKTEQFAELVCSNSLRAKSLSNAVGLLKEEMRHLNSLIIQAADQFEVPAGGALAVDREKFSGYITTKLQNHPNITIIRDEVTELNPETVTIIAAGPLCSESLSTSLASLLGEDYLHFYDAAAPILTYDSIDFSSAYFASRYDKGGADYINCPLSEAEYQAFWQALTTAEVQPLHDFEDHAYFEGCMPVEVMAARGPQTLLFGPLKPVGLIDPKTKQLPYAVVQLRQDNLEGTLYNIVGFQTRLKWPEQKRVFGMIPALKRAEFVRYGVMHKNTFINAPVVLQPTGQLKKYPNIFIAGQLSGVEGYVESAASGLLTGINAGRLLNAEQPLCFPLETAHGALMNYITTTPKKVFQPMNVTFGIMPALSERIRNKKQKKEKISERALHVLVEFSQKNQLLSDSLQESNVF